MTYSSILVRVVSLARDMWAHIFLNLADRRVISSDTFSMSSLTASLVLLLVLLLPDMDPVLAFLLCDSAGFRRLARSCLLCRKVDNRRWGLLARNSRSSSLSSSSSTLVDLDMDFLLLLSARRSFRLTGGVLPSPRMSFR